MFTSIGDADRERLDPLRDREGHAGDAGHEARPLRPGGRFTEEFEDSFGQYDNNYTCPRVRAVA
jgi:hypothetical protein